MKILSKPRARYPWDVWFRRKRFKLFRWRDYTCEPPYMAQQVRNAAKQAEAAGLGRRRGRNDRGLRARSQR